MHIELLVEDHSGAELLKIIMPKILGEEGQPHTWRIHSYKGMGRIPPGLKKGTLDPRKRVLLDRLPAALKGYGNTPGIDAVVVVVDTDIRDCGDFLAELKAVADQNAPALCVLFRLAIEEIEAWYLGDENALFSAYPKAKRKLLDGYAQDSACGTWELLADMVHPGGHAAAKKAGGYLPGQLKEAWAQGIGPLLDIENNRSPSFGKLRDGLRRLVAKALPKPD